MLLCSNGQLRTLHKAVLPCFLPERPCPEHRSRSRTCLQAEHHLADFGTARRRGMEGERPGMQRTPLRRDALMSMRKPRLLVLAALVARLQTQTTLIAPQRSCISLCRLTSPIEALDPREQGPRTQLPHCCNTARKRLSA